MRDYSLTIQCKDGQLDVLTAGGKHEDLTTLEILANPDGYRLTVGVLNKDRKAEVLGLNAELAKQAAEGGGSYM